MSKVLNKIKRILLSMTDVPAGEVGLTPKEQGVPDEEEFETLPWSTGLGEEVEKLVNTLKDEGRLGTIIDCGAGQGRHTIYAAEQGAKEVLAVEKDPKQTPVIRQAVKTKGFDNVKVIEGDTVAALEDYPDNSVDGIIDIGTSHSMTADHKARFFELVHSKLRTGGLYSILHWSDREELGVEDDDAEGGLTLDELKSRFPSDKWDSVMKWQDSIWDAEEGKQGKHYAYHAVLRKK
jgi:hypothetical protein